MASGSPDAEGHAQRREEGRADLVSRQPLTRRDDAAGTFDGEDLLPGVLREDIVDDARTLNTRKRLDLLQDATVEIRPSHGIVHRRRRSKIQEEHPLGTEPGIDAAHECRRQPCQHPGNERDAHGPGHGARVERHLV
ncbi:MAG TPA: hypothetical protein VIL35_04550, partial [Vicinamibacterales bacterium]